MKSFLKEYKILIKIIPIKTVPKVIPLKPWKYNAVSYDIDYLKKKPNKIPFDYEIFSK